MHFPELVLQASRAACAAVAVLTGARLFGETPAAGPKTHVLFMGADLALEKSGAMLPLEDVNSNTLVLRSKGTRIEVPIARGIDLLVTDVLKVATTNVNVSRLKTERAFSPGNDPFKNFSEAAAIGSNQSELIDLAAGELRVSNSAQIAAAQATLSRAQLETSRQIFQLDSHSGQLGSEALEAFDAIRVSFEIVAETNLMQPYFAVIAQIREPGSKAKARKWIYVKSLSAMRAGDKRMVQIYESDLAPGYHLDGCSVHIYNRGDELATNLSRKRVVLTEDEAQQYRIVEYISGNKGATRPATLLDPKIRQKAEDRLLPSQLDETYFVRVAKDGKVTETFRDSAATQPLQDPEVDAVIQLTRFRPALAAGKPIESIVALKLREMPLP